MHLKRNNSYAPFANLLVGSNPPECASRLVLIKKLIERNGELRVATETLLVAGNTKGAITKNEDGTRALNNTLQMGGLSL